jgi:hypothetical protein
MKKLLILILIASLSSCDNSSSEKKTKNDLSKAKLNKDYEIAEMFLQYDAEKIGLLSIIKNVPPEQVNLVLRDYLAKTFSSESFLINENPKYVVKLVDSIANKNNLTRKLTASIIFSYQFEMITKDEIIDEYLAEKEIHLSE